MALQPGSPALDQVPLNTNGCGTSIATDQRLMARPQGPTCDVGAFEAAPALSIDKTASAPGAGTGDARSGVACHGLVTYTIVLSNTGFVAATGVQLDDPLPAQVTFARWATNPGTASETGDVIAWTGAVGPNTDVTFAFVVTHTGSYGDVVTNTATYSHSSGTDRDSARFTVEGGVRMYVPVVLRNY